MWLSVRGPERTQAGTTLLSRPLVNMSAESVQQREVVNKNFGDILYHGAEQRRNF